MPPAKPTPKTPLIFDQVKLQTMTPPLTVRVERVKGNSHQVMPLPIKDGWGAAGQGWTEEEVMGLEQLTLDSYGGGTYRFTVTDGANESMAWVQTYSVQQYPEKIPAPAVPATIPNASNPNPLAWATMPATQPTASPITNFGAPMPGVIPFPYQQQPFQFRSTFGQQTPVGGGSANDELARMRDGLEQARLQANEERHKRELERIQDENRRLMNEHAARAAAQPAEDPALRARLEHEREERFKAALEAERVRSEAALNLLMAKLEHASKGPSEADQRVARLEEENRRAEERRQREAEQRVLEDRLREQREEARRDREAMMQMINSLKDRGPDPMIQMLMMQTNAQAEAAKEAARLQAETAKETARLNAESQRERTREQNDLLANLKHYMMSPTEVARMINDGQQGQHAFVKSMAGTFNDVAGVMRDWFQNMAATMAGPSESPAVRVLEGAVASAKDMFERWNQGKTQTEVARANAQARMAQSQAEAYAAANRPPQAPQPAPQQQQPIVTPPPATPPPAGAVAPTNGEAQPTTSWTTPPPVVQPPSPVRVGGRTDEQWFGPGLKEIQEFRAGAMHFCESVSMDPPRIREDGEGPEGTGPDEAAVMIMQAAAFITEKVKETPILAEQVPAFSYLFAQGMIPQLVEVIFPDVHPGYREDVCHFLFRLISGKPLHDPNEQEDEVDNQDDGEDGDDNHDGKPVPVAAAPTPSGRKPSPPPAPRRR